MTDRPRRDRGMQAVNLGLGTNIALAGLKTVFGVIGHSPALLADGINSTSDVAYYIVVRIFLGMAGKPADAEHPYGHRQLESIAALAVGAFVITTAIAIFWDSVNKVYDQLSGHTDPTGGGSLAALGVAVFTVLLKIGLSVYTLRVGKSAGNQAILALAYDHRNDIFAASAATIGILFGRSGFSWVDPLAGAVVALVILRTGVEILRKSSDDLMDTVPGQALAQQVKDTLSGVDGIVSIEEVLAHRFGPYLVINVTIGVQGTISVAAGDEIASAVERTLMNRLSLVLRVHVHYHPARDRAAELEPSV